ncbi:aquaporin [Alteribacillus bidgolensis]|uniref:aquaporin n=1 Tax=Alteribacillus bidgolensis TaxID=930129 RepID=UPI000B83F665|nr:aquaporin [Alteribacillus bidgolensis]
MALYRGFPWKKVISYICAQVAGTFTDAAFVFGLYYPAFVSYQESTVIVIGRENSQAMAGIFSFNIHAWEYFTVQFTKHRPARAFARRN